MSTTINLEDAVLDHLVVPESIEVFHRERLPLETIADDEVRQAVEWALSYRRQYGEAPSREVIGAETGWVDFREPEVPVEYVIDKLRERHTRRELKKIVTMMARKNQDPREALKVGFDEMAKLRYDTMPKGSSLTTHDDFLERYEFYKNRGPGLSFGFDELDAEIGGMFPGELYFGIGRPKRYKSWLYHIKSALVNLHNGHSSLIFTLELTEKEMHDRIYCMEAGVSWSRFKHRELLDKELGLVEQAKERLLAMEQQIYIRQPSFSQRTVTDLVEEAKLLPVDIVYIDQLSFIEHSDPKKPQYQQIKDICVELKSAAVNWPIMVAAQFNRDADKMDGMADLGKIGLSDAIGQTADLLLGLYADKEMQESNIVQIGVIESRSFGSYGRWNIKVDLGFNSNFRLIERVRQDG